MSAKATLNARIYEALTLQARYNEAYLVFGKTSSWVDDTHPPEEVEDTPEITEVIGYKKIRQFSLARPLAQGENPNSVSYPKVTYGGKTWLLIPRDKAYIEKAHWLYIDAEIQPDEFPLGMYRQVGIQMGVKPKTGISKTNLLPSEVQDKGTLYFFENREPQNRTVSVYVVEQFIATI